MALSYTRSSQGSALEISVSLRAECQAPRDFMWAVREDRVKAKSQAKRF